MRRCLALGPCLLLGAAVAQEAPPPRSAVELGPVRFEVEVVPAPARLSDEPELRLTVTAEEGIEVHLPPFGDSLGPFLVRDFSEPLPEVQGGLRVFRQTYRLEPLEVGTHVLPGIRMTFDDHRAQGDGKTHELCSEPVAVEITSLLASDAPRLEDLRPPAPAVELPEPRNRAPFWVLGGIAAAAALAVLWWWRRRHPEKVVVLTPGQWAEREFQALLEADPLGRGAVKEYYVEITGIVRRYIERSTGLRAPEQTTQEFLRAMQLHPGIPVDRKVALQAFLEAADLVKFAGHEPSPADIDRSYVRAREFVGLAPQPYAAREQAA